ncbi:MAG: aspartate/glutamate racemase family protein [Gammaproteobacteria bacterium]
MKKIGIVGGIAWPSTVEYYSEICRLAEEQRVHQPQHGALAMPEMSIESLDHDKAVAYIGTDGDEESWSRFDTYHRTALQRLEAGGARVAAIASNTSHHRLAEIVRGIGIPVISIFEAVARECARIGTRQVLILGTATTMRSARFREVFDAHGIEAAGPESVDIRTLTIRLSEELQHGKDERATARMGEIARAAFKGRFNLPAVVCLACTELPLAFPEFKTLTVFESNGIRYMNSSAVHIRAVFDYAASE